MIFRNIILGFIAGVIATLTIHQGLVYLFYDRGMIPSIPWDMTPIENGPLAGQLPKVLNSAFWGGLWGSVFALILGSVPKGALTFRGIALGIVGPALIGRFLLVPYLKGAEPFFGGDVSQIVAVLCIAAGFGAVTAWLYGFFTSGMRLP